MNKEFNTTGNCIKEIHYMMDASSKLDKVMNLIYRNKYFVINRPRQYGKTTMLHLINQELMQKDTYFSIHLNFQGVNEGWEQSDTTFTQMFMELLIDVITLEYPELNHFLSEIQASVTNMTKLSKAITKIVHKIDKKIVLLIDEIDASSNHLIFLQFLGMLRNKYLNRFQRHQTTFHSIVLAGVHDIKTLKYKIRSKEETQYNSPWNIAADFNVDMSFNTVEIAPMLEEYCQVENIEMDIPLIANRLHHYTAGYPFLVSKLCKLIAESILPKKEEKKWTLEDVEQAVQLLLRENNTNFDSLIKKLENNTDLYNLVYNILIDGANISFNQHNPIIHLGILYGIFKRNGSIRIHNRIYEQIIYNYLASKTETSFLTKNDYANLPYSLPNNELDIEQVLLNFQKFAKEQYSTKQEKFLEKQWRLLLLAFLQPILNGQGYTFKEAEISQEKRLDVVITYFQHKYIIELKIWYGQKAYERGLQQLSDYLDAQHQQKGFLVIFEEKKKKSWKQEYIKFKDKNIFAVWV